MLATMRKSAGRLALLSPFDPERDSYAAAESTPAPETASAYGCVEWFHYLDSRPAPTGPATAKRRHGSRRP